MPTPLPSPADQQPWSLRQLWPGVYLPAIVVEIGIGAIVPFIPATVVDQGGTLAMAGLLAAMLPIGRIVADVPAGALTHRIGDRRAMLLACLLVAVVMAFAAVLVAFVAASLPAAADNPVTIFSPFTLDT